MCGGAGVGEGELERAGERGGSCFESPYLNPQGLQTQLQ